MFFQPDEQLTARMLQRMTANRVEASIWQAKLKSVASISSFITSRESYGATGVRDAHLSFHMEDLGGTFHFIRFETRRTEGALRLLRKYGLNTGMHTICATGGGALKVRGSARAKSSIVAPRADSVVARHNALLVFTVGAVLNLNPTYLYSSPPPSPNAVLRRRA